MVERQATPRRTVQGRLSEVDSHANAPHEMCVESYRRRPLEAAAFRIWKAQRSPIHVGNVPAPSFEIRNRSVPDEQSKIEPSVRDSCTSNLAVAHQVRAEGIFMRVTSGPLSCSWALGSILLCSACAAPDPASEVEQLPSEKIPVAAASTVRERLALDKTSASRRYTLLSPTARPIETIVKNLDEGFDWFSMVGSAADAPSSEFMLKGNQRGVYGWLVYRDRDLAYEYTTNAEGVVEVEQVPVTKIFAVCNVPEEAHDPGSEASVAPATVARLELPAEAAKPWPPHVGQYPGTDVRKLQSRPDETKVWYIDITDTMNGDTPKEPQSKEDIFRVWAITAATLYPFKVNVTTDAEVYAKAGVQNSGCTEMIQAGIGDRSGCGLGTFGSRSCCQNHIYGDAYGTGRIVNHEAGHGWGLLHDGGDNGGEYFNGFSEFEWTPLMGNVWPGDRWDEALFQFSKGEYDSSTNDEDDFEIITESIDYVDDDIPETTALTLDGVTVARSANWGQIHRNTDSDAWTFKVGTAGHATLKIERLEDKGGGMLDVDATLLDSTGKELAHDNPKAARYANLDVALPPGDYKLVIKGGAEGNLEEGFTNYSSVGLYSIEGTINGGVSTGGGFGGMGGASGSGGMGSGGTAGAGSGGLGGMPSAGGSQTTPNGGTSAGSGGLAGPSFAGAGGGSTVGLSPGSTDASGCGCRTAGSPSSSGWTLFPLLAALGIARRRRAISGRKRGTYYGSTAGEGSPV
jgi:MYXO-CTERM domain-containing protein